MGIWLWPLQSLKVQLLTWIWDRTGYDVLKIQSCQSNLYIHFSFSQEKTHLSIDNLLMAWPTPEEPEPLIINEVLYQMTPVFKQPYCPKRQETLSHSTPKEDTIYIASSPLPTGTLTADTRKLVNLYKMLGRREPDSKLGNLTNSLTVAPDYLSSHEGYLPSNMEDHSPHEDPSTDSLELEHQHISLSIFASGSLRPLTFCGERLTLDQLKMGYDSLTSNEAWCLESQCIPLI